MKKEYIVYKLSECAKQACRIDNELFTKYNVKRGLRNEDGTGVLVGLTKIGNVVGYERTDQGLKAIPGKLFYRGYDLDDIAHALLREKRFGFEEVAYLLLSGELPDSEQLASFKELINDNMPLDKKTTMNIIDLEGQNIMNILARSVLEMYTFDPNPDDISRDNLMRQSIELISKFPTIIAYAYSIYRHSIHGRSLHIRHPHENLSLAENFLYMIKKEYTPLEARMLDFCFNGWGMKFAAHKDNLINSHLFKTGALNGDYINCRNFVLEGGSIESDGEGTLLTTSPCLLAPNRNDTLSRKDIEAYLMERFNLRQVLWLDYGYLAGDDTDSHVDTLARLCPDHTITYVQCVDKDDEHYGALRSMEDQLKTFRTLDGDPYRLLPLPMPEAIYDEDGERLPATYANFLIMNEAVLYPTYAQPENDARAAQVLAEAFPGREIVGIDCRALIKQHGPLHCVTMQYPESVKNQIAQ